MLSTSMSRQMMRHHVPACILGCVLLSCSVRAEAVIDLAPGRAHPTTELPTGANSRCSEPNFVIATTRLQELPRGVLRRDWRKLSDDTELEIDKVKLVSGPCAELVVRANATTYQLGNGITVFVSERGSVLREPKMDLGMATLSSPPYPILEGAEFRMASGLSAGELGPFIGLFSNAPNSILASFIRCPGGDIEGVKPLISFARPIRSITTLAGYHAPAATTVAVVAGKNPLIITLKWRYRKGGTSAVPEGACSP